jgi:hypothetical protein
LYTPLVSPIRAIWPIILILRRLNSTWGEYIWRFNSYRTVNTLRYHYNTKCVNSAQWNNFSLLLEKREKTKTLWAVHTLLWMINLVVLIQLPLGFKRLIKL